MKIKLTSGFQTIPEGHYTFKIDSVKYDENFGKMEVNLVTENGLRHKENFSLLQADGQPNDGAYAAFSMLARAALGSSDIEEIDHTDIVGKFFEADVEHDIKPSTKDPNKNLTFVKLNNRTHSDGWAVQEVDLNSILG